MNRIVLVLLCVLVVPCFASEVSRTIFDAIREGKAEEIARMAREGQVNSRDGDGRTPLMVAAERGDEEIVAILIKGGAELEARDRFGFTVIERLESILRRVGERRLQLQEAMRRQGLAESAIEQVLSASEVPNSPDERSIQRITRVLHFLLEVRKSLVQ